MKIYVNGKIITMNSSQDIVSAIAIEDGKILKVGTDEEVLALKDDNTEVIDLEMKTMTPGFIDPHSHYSLALKSAAVVNISAPPIGKVECIDDLIAVMRDAITPETTSLVGNGYDHEQLKEKRQLTKFDLDKISDSIPVYAGHVSGHVGTMNSAALRANGIDENTENPSGGVIARIEGSNEPNGFLEENAWMLTMFHIMPRLTEETVEKMANIGQQYYSQYGVTTSQDGFVGDGEYDVYKLLAEKDLLDIDVHGYVGSIVPSKILNKEVDFKHQDKLGNFKFSGYKIFLDGSPQARTAWMSKPYQVVNPGDDPEYVGYPIYDDATVIKGIKVAVEDKAQFLVHCNGDEASEQFIRCYQHVVDDLGPIDDIRPVMVHCQTLREDQLDRMKGLGILPTFFVAHTFYFGDTHIENFGIERAKQISNMRYAIDNGIRCTTHEDSPVAPPNVLFSMWAAVNRVTRSGKTLGEEYKLTPYEVLTCYTVNGAYQYFEEDIKGTLEVGKIADLVIMDKNILDVEPTDIKDIKVLETIKRGKTIYKATN